MSKMREMNMNYYSLVFFIILVLGCVVQKTDSAVVNFSGRTAITVEIADSPAEWQEGLMHRSVLPEGKGMLFIFPDEGQRSFWMKNTLIPLDMIFVSANYTIIDINKNAQPCSVCDSYRSSGRAKYVIEVNANFTSEHNISIGDTIKIE